MAQRIVCPKCGAKNAFKSRFCSACGAELRNLPAEPVKEAAIEVKKASKQNTKSANEPENEAVLGTDNYRRLKKLFDEGGLTKEEFETMKAELSSASVRERQSSVGVKEETAVGEVYEEPETEELNEKLDENNEEETKKLMLGHFKPRFFVIIGSLAIIVIIIALLMLNNQLNNPLINSTNGQSAHNNTKTVVSCTANSCQTGYYCSSYGACLKAFCGDGICTAQERANNSCPIDCGCSSGQVLNKHLNECQQNLSVSNAAIDTAVDNYLQQNSINGTIINITNGYYGNQAVKIASVNCAAPSSKYPCQIVFYVNSNAQIINETYTT